MIEGTGAFFDNKYNVIVSKFIKNKPTGWTVTYLDGGKERYSFYENGKETIVHDDLKYVENYKLIDD